MTPQFTHDCNQCIYLGSDSQYDYYACGKLSKTGINGTLIARYGSEGSHYASGLETALAFENKDPEYCLVKALKLARKQGII